MLDLYQIISDLIELRKAKTDSQREFAGMAGINFAKVNAIENRTRGIWLKDFDKWLDACEISTPRYFAQKLAMDELGAAEKDRELISRLVQALLIPGRRKAIEGLVESWPDANESKPQLSAVPPTNPQAVNQKTKDSSSERTKKVGGKKERSDPSADHG